MALLPEPTREYLTRKEAAAYLSRKWFPISAATLNAYASRNAGPVHGVVSGPGGKCLYRIADLDAWAMRCIKPARVRSLKAVEALR